MGQETSEGDESERVQAFPLLPMAIAPQPPPYPTSFTSMSLTQPLPTFLANSQGNLYSLPSTFPLQANVGYQQQMLFPMFSAPQNLHTTPIIWQQPQHQPTMFEIPQLSSQTDESESALNLVRITAAAPSSSPPNITASTRSSDVSTKLASEVSEDDDDDGDDDDESYHSDTNAFMPKRLTLFDNNGSANLVTSQASTSTSTITSLSTAAQTKHICQKCLKTFGRAKDLQRHASVHEVTNQFSCETCGLSYKRRDGLLRHVRTKHTEKSTKKSRLTK